MRRTLILGLFVAFACAVPASAQTDITPVEPFKVGTFDIHGVPHVGLVLRDSLVIDIEAANMALASNPDYATVPMPEDMLELIGRYEYGLRYRLYEIVNDAVNNNRLTGSGRASFVYDVAELRTRPPIMYPGSRTLMSLYARMRRILSSAEPAILGPAAAPAAARAALCRNLRRDNGIFFMASSRFAISANVCAKRYQLILSQ